MPPLVPVFVASLLGSAHCAAMCGGFACLYVGDSRGPTAHVAYNAGRLVAYLTVGALAGLLGAAVSQAGALVGIGRAAAIMSGTLLLVWGGHMLLRAVGVRLPLPAPRLGQRLLGPALARVRDASTVTRAGTIGLLTALLPCGWLYAFAVTAAGAGTVPGAMMTMAVFWLGTLPAMAAVGAGVQRLAGPFRRRLPLVTAVSLMLIGTLTMAGRLVPRPMIHTAPATHGGHR